MAGLDSARVERATGALAGHAVVVPVCLRESRWYVWKHGGPRGPSQTDRAVWVREAYMSIEQADGSPAGTSDSVLERDIAGRETIRSILRVAGVDNYQQVIDYGGGRGVWSRDFPQSVVYDPFPSEWGAPSETQRFTDRLDDLPTAECILLINTQRMLSDRETHEWLDFSFGHLEPGGQVLLTVPSPLLLAEWVLTGRRVKHDGLRFQAVWAGLAAFGAIRRIGRSDRHFYCVRKRAFVKAAELHGLQLVRVLPKSIDRRYWAMMDRPLRGRGYHWLVFERP